MGSPDIYRKRGAYYLEPGSLSDDLSETLRDAVAAQPVIGKPITVIFNGTSVKVEEGMDVHAAYRQWAETREGLQAQSRLHPAGTSDFWEMNKAEENRLDQEALDYVTGDGLDFAVAGGLSGIVAWAKDYIGLYNRKLDNHGKHVQEKLEALGYQQSVEEEKPPQAKEELGRYIVGLTLYTVISDWLTPRMEINALCDAYSAMPDSRPMNVMRPLSLKSAAPGRIS